MSNVDLMLAEKPRKKKPAGAHSASILSANIDVKGMAENEC